MQTTLRVGSNQLLKMKRISVSLIVFFVFAAALWTGVSYYIGMRTQADIAVLMNQPDEQTNFRLTDWEHSGGPFYSSGRFLLHYRDPDALMQPRPDLFVLEVRYDMDHRAWPSRVFAMDWSAEPYGYSALQMATIFGTKPNINGSGQLGWQARIESNYAFSALSANDGTQTLAVAAMNGNVAIQDKAMQFDLKLPSLLVQTPHDNLRLENLTIELDLIDRLSGLGQSRMRVQRIGFDGGVVQGLEISGLSTQSDDRFNFELGMRLANLSIAGQQVTETALNVLLSGLDATSVQTLSRVFDQAGNSENLTPAQQEDVQRAIKRIIVQGFELSVPAVESHAAGAKLTGSATLVLKPSSMIEPIQFDAATQLLSTGQLTIQGKIQPHLAALIMMSGVFLQTDQGLSARYRLLGGRLDVNGKSVPISAELMQINEAIETLLESP